MSSSTSSGSSRIALLISGSGTNLQAFIDQTASGKLDCNIAVVVSNCSDAFGLRRAEQAGIATNCVEHENFDDRESFDREVARALDAHQPRLVILAGFMRILSPWFVQHYAGRILNIHPALLPKYAGLNTHARVLDAGDTHHGSTVHFVTEELDGGPRILTGCLQVDHNDTADRLAARVQAVEHRIYPQAVDWFLQGRLEFRDGNACLDGKPLIDPVVIDFDS